MRNSFFVGNGDGKMRYILLYGHAKQQAIDCYARQVFRMLIYKQFVTMELGTKEKLSGVDDNDCSSFFADYEKKKTWFDYKVLRN